MINNPIARREIGVLFRDLLNLKGLDAVANHTLKKVKEDPQYKREYSRLSKRAADKAKELQPRVKEYMEYKGIYQPNKEITATRNPKHLEKLLDVMEGDLMN